MGFNREGVRPMTTEIEAPNRAPATAQRMADAARRFLASLRPEQRKVATFPFLGANPAESRMGPDKGDRILPEEEDMARDLLAALDVPRKAQAIYSPVAPGDILTDINRRVYPGVVPLGLNFAQMDERQRGKLV